MQHGCQTPLKVHLSHLSEQNNDNCHEHPASYMRENNATLYSVATGDDNQFDARIYSNSLDYKSSHLLLMEHLKVFKGIHTCSTVSFIHSTVCKQLHASLLIMKGTISNALSGALSSTPCWFSSQAFVFALGIYRLAHLIGHKPYY